MAADRACRAQSERGRRTKKADGPWTWVFAATGSVPCSPSVYPILQHAAGRSLACSQIKVKPTDNGWRRAPKSLVVQPPCGRVRQELRSIFRTAATRCTLAAGAQPCYFPLAVSRSRRTHPLTCTESDLCTGGARHRLLPRVGPNGRHAFSQHRRDEEGVPCGHAPARPQGLPDQGAPRLG